MAIHQLNILTMSVSKMILLLILYVNLVGAWKSFLNNIMESGREVTRSFSSVLKPLENKYNSKNDFLEHRVIESSDRRSLITIGGVEDLPFIAYASTVEFHFLLSSLPYNTDASLAAIFSQISDGTELPSLHVGLGIWDTSTDTKISIEFVPKNFLSCLVPTLTSDRKIRWDNLGSIVVKEPMDSGSSSFGYPGNWRESRLVSTSSGEKKRKMFLFYFSMRIFFEI
jgi:hypothetical protein